MGILRVAGAAGGGLLGKGFGLLGKGGGLMGKGFGTLGKGFGLLGGGFGTLGLSERTRQFMRKALADSVNYVQTFDAVAKGVGKLTSVKVTSKGTDDEDLADVRQQITGVSLKPQGTRLQRLKGIEDTTRGISWKAKGLPKEKEAPAPDPAPDINPDPVNEQKKAKFIELDPSTGKPIVEVDGKRETAALLLGPTSLSPDQTVLVTETDQGLVIEAAGPDQATTPEQKEQQQEPETKRSILGGLQQLAPWMGGSYGVPDPVVITFTISGENWVPGCSVYCEDSKGQSVSAVRAASGGESPEVEIGETGREYGWFANAFISTPPDKRQGLYRFQIVLVSWVMRTFDGGFKTFISDSSTWSFTYLPVDTFSVPTVDGVEQVEFGDRRIGLSGENSVTSTVFSLFTMDQIYRSWHTNVLVNIYSIDRPDPISPADIPTEIGGDQVTSYLLTTGATIEWPD